MSEMRPCRWPGCSRLVEPRFYACYKHWNMLPQSHKSAIWAAYTYGQESNLAKVSDAWIEADRQAREWATAHDGTSIRAALPGQLALPFGD